MPRETAKHVDGDYWLEFRRDGKAPGIHQIAWYDARARQVRYRSTRTADVETAVGALHAHAQAMRAKRRQDPHDALVVPLLSLYWDEVGADLINRDQTKRSLRTFFAFLDQDEATASAVVTDLVPALFERFRRWRMKPHKFDMAWAGSAEPYQSRGVSGDTVARNLNDIRAAINHAEANGRIPYAPRIKSVNAKHLNPPRERLLSIDELGRIYWYARHYPALFRFVALQLATAVRPDAAKQFNPLTQYNDRTRLIDLQPGAAPRTKKRNAVIPAIRPLRPILLAWQRDGHDPQASFKTAWRIMRRTLGLSADVHAKTIRHTVATWLYRDPAIPERDVSEMMGHGLRLHRTTMIYAKYDPAYLVSVRRGLTTLWREVSAEARRFDAVHMLSTERTAKGRFVAREVRKR